MNLVGWHWTHCKTYGKMQLICCPFCLNAMLLGYYVVYPPFAFNNASTLLGVDFTSVCTTFTSRLFHSFYNFFHRSSLLVGRSFTELETPIYFIPKVFNRIHVRGLWTPWQYYDCRLVSMLWVIIMLEHPPLQFFSEQQTCSHCPLGCSDHARYSLFLQF